jgi:hypothetical protein
MSILKNIKLFKNIFITTGVTFLFGMYSIYHLYFYIRDLDNKIHNLKIREKDYEQLEMEVKKINNKLNLLSDKISGLNATNEFNENYLNLNINAEESETLEERTFEETETLEGEETETLKEKENKNISEYTCVSVEDFDHEPMEIRVRSRSSSLSWVKKSIFG